MLLPLSRMLQRDHRSSTPSHLVRQALGSRTMASRKRVWRSGVRFDCEECGLLWKDDVAHAPRLEAACLTCGGDLHLVGRGERMVENARWYRCLHCHTLHMERRGELVETGERSGFAEYTRFGSA